MPLKVYMYARKMIRHNYSYMRDFPPAYICCYIHKLVFVIVAVYQPQL